MPQNSNEACLRRNNREPPFITHKKKLTSKAKTLFPGRREIPQTIIWLWNLNIQKHMCYKFGGALHEEFELGALIYEKEILQFRSCHICQTKAGNISWTISTKPALDWSALSTTEATSSQKVAHWISCKRSFDIIPSMTTSNRKTRFRVVN